MNGLFTEVKIKPSDSKISHKDNILLIGSCFTDEIGGKFQICGFNTLKNPFGILYNPLSIATCLNRIAKQEFFSEEDLILSNEYYYLFSAHGDYRAKTKEECLEKINKSIKLNHEFLKQSDYIFLTLGTSWTYWYKPLNYLMGNCHKIDNKLIERRLIPYNESSKALLEAIQTIKTVFKKEYKIIFTLSPIRHWREGYRDNLVSKSHLVLAIEEMQKKDLVSYFPSYEIVMDELRDYRFYAEDMLHVNSTAVNYIWEKLSQTYFSSQTQELNKLFHKLWTMQNHRPLNSDTTLYSQHKEKIAELKQELQPHTNLILH